MERRSILLVLWIFATLNYLYCDVLGLMDPNLLKGFLAGKINGIDISQGFLLASGVLVEIPIAMVLLTWLLPQRANRWANIAAAAVMTLVQAGTLVFKSPTLYYTFFSIIEIATTAVIVWYAWARPSGAPELVGERWATTAPVGQ
jgi:hypothetical protein